MCVTGVQPCALPTSPPLGLDIETVEADVAALPFADGEFDLCVTFNGLHCLPDPPSAVSEMARCVRPGGRIVGDSVVRGAGLRQDVAIGMFRRAGLFGPGGTAAEVERWLDGAGLRIDPFQVSCAAAHFAAPRPGRRS